MAKKQTDAILEQAELDALAEEMGGIPTPTLKTKVDPAPAMPPVAIEAPVAPVAKPKHTLKNDVEMVGNFMSRGLRVFARKPLEKSSVTPTVRQGLVVKVAAAAVIMCLMIATIVGAGRLVVSSMEEQTVTTARLAVEMTLDEVRKDLATQTAELEPYLAPADTSPHALKLLAYPSTPGWLLWARRAPRLNTGLVTRMTMPGDEKPFAHWRDGNWYEGAGPDLHLPQI